MTSEVLKLLAFYFSSNVKYYFFVVLNIAFILLEQSWHRERTKFVSITIGLIEISCFAKYTALRLVPVAPPTLTIRFK